MTEKKEVKNSISNNQNSANSNIIKKSNTSDNEFKILITTDNHLGFKEDDKVIGNDSFYAFDESLRM
jgi:hypothetical protein